ncbi:hypothetical protein DLM_3022 [Aquitalea magnusonii]|uniref:Uncharacterized protein n=1 Tax=Aquitalea magnusonii TaxID=332411 RepID=A0A3G9GKQ4_9NEIS|nr:hypothetical protein [Aquitalea magnusonii]BBF86622.1 hypothetical protein DLM_3022 [Aquitalea magnusonii]
MNGIVRLLLRTGSAIRHFAAGASMHPAAAAAADRYQPARADLAAQPCIKIMSIILETHSKPQYLLCKSRIFRRKTAIFAKMQQRKTTLEQLFHS